MSPKWIIIIELFLGRLSKDINISSVSISPAYVMDEPRKTDGVSVVSNRLFIDCRGTRQRVEPQKESVGTGSAGPAHRRPVCCNLQGSCL